MAIEIEKFPDTRVRKTCIYGCIFVCPHMYICFNDMQLPEMALLYTQHGKRFTIAAVTLYCQYENSRLYILFHDVILHFALLRRYKIFTP